MKLDWIIKTEGNLIFTVKNRIYISLNFNIISSD